MDGIDQPISEIYSVDRQRIPDLEQRADGEMRSRLKSGEDNNVQEDEKGGEDQPRWTSGLGWLRCRMLSQPG